MKLICPIQKLYNIITSLKLDGIVDYTYPALQPSRLRPPSPPGHSPSPTQVQAETPRSVIYLIENKKEYAWDH